MIRVSHTRFGGRYLVVVTGPPVSAHRAANLAGAEARKIGKSLGRKMIAVSMNTVSKADGFEYLAVYQPE